MNNAKLPHQSKNSKLNEADQHSERTGDGHDRCHRVLKVAGGSRGFGAIAAAAGRSGSLPTWLVDTSFAEGFTLNDAGGARDLLECSTFVFDIATCRLNVKCTLDVFESRQGNSNNWLTAYSKYKLICLTYLLKLP
jgi:hypothetical protein